MEGYLSRLVEETGRNRTALADDLRGEFKLLARTIASSRGGSSAAWPLLRPVVAAAPPTISGRAMSMH